MADLAGRSYIPKPYTIKDTREPVVDLLLRGIRDGGGRIVSCSFPDRMVAPIYIGAEDGDNRRYGLLVYPFTTTCRDTRNRPAEEHRFQIRYGDPKRVRHEQNPLGHDPAGVDITLILAVDPETELVVGLDPLLYEELPMGISGYYRQRNADAVTAEASQGWAAWAKETRRRQTKHRDSWDGLESMVGFRPDRLLDYARFEALATSLGLDTGMRLALAGSFADGFRRDQRVDRHDLVTLFGVDAATILDIIESNFRLGVTVRGSVAEHHLGRLLAADPAVARCEAIDKDGEPDFRIKLHDGRDLTIECKNALGRIYKDGYPRIETQKTRDSGAGRRYDYNAFHIVSACMFPANEGWTFKFKWARDLAPWKRDKTKIGPIQRIDDTWADSLDDLLEREPQQ